MAAFGVITEVTVRRLTEIVGCSYPTAARSLKRIQRHLHRHSDRRVELRAWPRSAWAELLALAPRLRGTMLYTDPSAEPTRPARMIEDLAGLRRPTLALGGVIAARHWDPAFDLHGTPRLDLSVHAQGGRPDLSFIKQLDPALLRIDDPTKPIALAVHFVHQAEHGFLSRSSLGVDVADPIETLLDLHELGLVKQAGEMLERLGTKRK